MPAGAMDLCSTLLLPTRRTSGTLARIEHRATGRMHRLAHDAVTVSVDGRTCDAASAPPPAVVRRDAAAAFHFCVEGRARLDLVYALRPGAGHIERRVERQAPPDRAVTHRDVAFGPLRFAEPPAETVVYDTFRELGGDVAMLNPMFECRKPEGRTDAFWDFAPEQKEWKKTDDAGNAAAENCMACDEYAEWFRAVQANTIHTFGLRLWDWAPGRGFVFLCNPNPRPARIAFGLDDEIGLEAAGGRFALTELYPIERRARGAFAAGEQVTLIVPADEVVLLELAPDSARPVPAPAQTSDRTPPPRRALDDWSLPDGSRFAFPRHAAAAQLTLETGFAADPRIRDLLAAARPLNLAEIEPLIPEWKKQYPDNFAWARPDRLWLVLPFADADRAGGVALRVNTNDVPVECHAIRDRKIVYYADVTDTVRWGETNALRLVLADLGENQFLGPYLDYPSADPVAEALAAEAAPVIYDGRPLDPDMPARVPAGPADTRALPVVTAVSMTPGYYRGGETTRVLATVNLPPEELEAVYVSAGPWWNDEPMRHDEQAGGWVFDFRPPPRWCLIMDVPRHHVRAVARNGLVGPRRSLDVRWRFGDGPAPAATGP